MEFVIKFYFDFILMTTIEIEYMSAKLNSFMLYLKLEPVAKTNSLISSYNFSLISNKCKKVSAKIDTSADH